MANFKTTSITIGGFLLGGLLATGLTLLMAPRSGERTRHKIRRNLLRARGKASEALEDTRSQVTDKARQWADDANQELHQASKGIRRRGNQFVKQKGSLVGHRASQVLESL
jgi:gas vesicle protein